MSPSFRAPLPAFLQARPFVLLALVALSCRFEPRGKSAVDAESGPGSDSRPRGASVDAETAGPGGTGQGTGGSNSNAGGAGGSSGQGGSGASNGGNGGAGSTDGPAPSPPPSCSPGQHACGSECVANSSPKTCGQSCDYPCPPIQGGTATCDGTRCGVSCPMGMKPCHEACIPEASACQGSCPAGKTACNGVCVDPKSPGSCGPSCTPCPSPGPDGQPICDGETCDIACNAGYHKCGTTCAKDGDPSKCGDSCSACQAPSGGQAVCRNGGCDFDCATGVKCGNQCIARDQPCNNVCPGGTRDCGGRCVPAGDGSCCGDQECGACKSCQNFRCQPTANGQQGPQCSGVCRQCQNGACVSRPATTTCSPRSCKDSTVVEGRCSDGECQQQSVQDCPTGPTCSGSNLVLRGCFGGQCQQQTIQNCASGRTCSNNNLVEGQCSGNQCGSAVVQTCGSCETCNGDHCEPKDCGPNRHCQNGACVDICGPGNGCPLSCTPDNDPDCKRDNGTQCQSGNQCKTGNCVDGVCCNTTCNDGCSRCDGGTCTSSCTNGRRCINRQCKCPDDTIDTGSSCQPCGKANPSDPLHGQPCCLTNRCTQSRTVCTNGSGPTFDSTVRHHAEAHCEECGGAKICCSGPGGGNAQCDADKVCASDCTGAYCIQAAPGCTSGPCCGRGEFCHGLCRDGVSCEPTSGCFPTD